MFIIWTTSRSSGEASRGDENIEHLDNASENDHLDLVLQRSITLLMVHKYNGRLPHHIIQSLPLKRRRIGALVRLLLLPMLVKIGHSRGQVDSGAYSRGRQRVMSCCPKVCPITAEILGWRNDM